MLELKNIQKSYKTGDFVQTALDGVSVAFRDSEFVAVLGPSGSGKTTLLNVIGGLDHYDDGDLLINGISTKKFKDKDWDGYRNYEVGFVFQNYNLIPHQNILSNVELALTLSGISKQERIKRATQALTEVGLEDHMKKYPNQLSGGQQQRVAIARALVNNPSIVFADEPTGALDTKTSVAIMDILKKVSKDRLVVMVTHNPALAEEYATRIVNLQDGKIINDSRPLEVGTEKEIQASKKRRTAMSFFTALSLSFANLMGKKGRTFMTAFAGSIGIIGIAAILALSTGTRAYIEQVQNNTLSQYPLYITKSKSMIAGLSDSAQSGSLSQKIKDMQYNHQDEGTIGVRATVSTLLSTSGANDLKSLKEYLETDPDDINENISSMEYSYNASPVIYSNDPTNTRELYPSSTLGSTGTGSSSTTSKAPSVSQGSQSYFSTFYSLPKDEDLYKDQYTIAAGRWPENTSECVMVLHQDGTISDLDLYTLGLRDYKEFQDAVQAYYLKEKANIPDKYDDIKYDDVLNKTFKVINPSEVYSYDAGNKLWVDNSSNKEYMNNLVSRSKELKIVGIVNAPEGMNQAMALSAGINYTYELNEESINNAANSQIVQEQLSNPKIDVLSGKTFTDEKENPMSGFPDMSSLIQINPDALTNVFNFDKSALNMEIPKANISEEQINQIIASALNEQVVEQIFASISGNAEYSQDVKEIMIQAANQYVEYAKIHPETSPRDFFSESGPGYLFIQQTCAAAGIDLTPVVLGQIAQVTQNVCLQLMRVLQTSVMQVVSTMTESMTNLDSAFSFNQDALKDVIKFDFSEEKLMQLSKIINGAATRTYETNLSDFGYADLTDPIAITIYPYDFVAKDKVSECIDKYSQEQEDSGHKEKAISYTDYAKVLMNSVTTMIDMITAVLIAFVAISLVVSSFMIGIITYVSVLERRREIGILRAIGARKRDIFRVFNAETFIIGFAAGLIGIIITMIGCIPANIIAEGVFDVQYDIAVLPLWAAISLIAISIFLTLVAGLIPSSAASRKDPVEAINS